MGDRTHLQRSSGLRLLLRLLSVVAALLVLCVSGRASAATTAVPMCGDHNESIAAPPIFRDTDGGTIKALPCHGPEQIGVGQSAPASPERVIVYEAPERALGLGRLFVSRGTSSRISIASASTALELPGFVGTLFRPPRA